MSGQTDLSPALSALKKTKTLNTDMYSTFMKTWANSLSEGSARRSQTRQEKKKRREQIHDNEWSSTAQPVQRCPCRSQVREICRL